MCPIREGENTMNIIKWDENFSVGIYEIDEQHKELFNLINNIINIIKEEDYTFSNLLFVVNNLDNYIAEHLRHEEMLMEKCSFPYKEKHIIEHNFVRHKVHEINIFLVENFEEKFFLDTLNWLVAWLRKHIITTDKILEPYL